MNRHEQINRQAKVDATVAALDQSLHNEGYHVIRDAKKLALLLEMAGEPAWRIIANTAGVNMPSAETRRMVCSVYRSRAYAADRRQTDPFEGLAS